ncbi:hypothetical protein SAMN05421503_1465 [Terribacillus aidingensis]|uniref:Uncharacterized protein n=1 Tax=Terribacillus aidingensis TaxID=586416 RepID=A0A285NQW1_9BACI|nr:hypothetical protein SAMN05421503_1465 [Terribacillus aidingensis]
MLSYLIKTKLTLLDQIIVSAVGGLVTAIVLAIVAYLLKISY